MGRVEVVADVPGLRDGQCRQFGRDGVDAGVGDSGNLPGITGGDQPGEIGAHDDVSGCGEGWHDGCDPAL